MAITHFHRLLEAKIAGVLEARADDLCSGRIPEAGGYLAAVSYITALKDVLSLCDEIERELGER